LCAIQIKSKCNKIEIAFTPDFTLSRIERELLILTSLGKDSVEIEGINENGMARLTLLTTVPAHTLESCAAILTRPTWERAVQLAAISLSVILLACILAVSFLEADRILRGALANLSRTNPVQPTLDLRLCSHTSTQSVQTLNVSKEKASNEEKNKSSKKDENLPDWSLMNVKRNKEKDTQKGLKIPDWTTEEERRFKIDTETKEVSPPFKRCEDLSILDNGSNGNGTVCLTTKKKNGKKQNNTLEVQPESTCVTDNASSTDVQLVQEKKYLINYST
jgi:hypothetical protein